MNEEISEKNKTAKLQNLPEGWKWVNGGTDILLIPGMRPFGGATDEGIPSLGGEHITMDGKVRFNETNAKFVPFKFYNSIDRGKAKINDILINKDGANTGKVAILRKMFAPYIMVNEHVFIVRSKSFFDQNFLFYYLFSHYGQNQIKSKITGSAQPGLSSSFIKSFYLLFPTLPEQRKIAEILETVDNAIEKTDQIIEKYKRIKQGLMQELLTKGIDENGKIRDEKTHHFKASPLGRIPEEWKVTRLGEIASKEKYSFVDGPFGSNLKTVHYTTSGILVIQSNYFTKGKFNVINPTFTTEEKANELLRSNTKPSDIVIAKIGANYGAVAIIPETITRAVLSGNTMKITLDKNIANNVYVCFYLGYFKETDKINRILAAGSAQPALSLYGYKNLKIPLPPLPEQQRIAAILSQIDEVIEKETQYRDKLKRLKAGLMQDLLTGKVRVNKLIKQGA